MLAKTKVEYDDIKSGNITEYIHQKREMTESLKYASYIQKALLPGEYLLKKIFPEHFLIFKPRDIVSGDFFWYKKRKSNVYIAMGDCTGHGVPGAFMSILGITSLNDIITRGCFSSAGSIMNQLRERIMLAMNQTGEDTEMKDGIDMSLCIINTETNIMEYAGAFSPVYVIQNKKLTEIHGDKMPIGIAAYEEKPFTTHRLKLKDGDMIYLFTDGFVDQFGGPEGKKYKYQPFRNLLLRIHEEAMQKQHKVVVDSHDSWRGKQTQLDDITIIGIRYRVNS